MTYWLTIFMLGLGVGAVAAWVAPSRDPGGPAATILLAVGGAVCAAFLDRMVDGNTRVSDGSTMLASLIGAMFVLFVFRLAVRWRTRTTG
jgi:uncharacterized membrane protein YeaQ/YmgE (transglycosylase-associated protein family)